MGLVGVASMFIALFNTQSIVSILMFCFTLRAAGSFFPYVMGHYWKKASKAGTIASLLAGTIVVVYLEHISGGVGENIRDLFETAVGRFLYFGKIYPHQDRKGKRILISQLLQRSGSLLPLLQQPEFQSYLHLQSLLGRRKQRR